VTVGPVEWHRLVVSRRRPRRRAHRCRLRVVARPPPLWRAPGERRREGVAVAGGLPLALLPIMRGVGTVRVALPPLPESRVRSCLVMSRFLFCRTCDHVLSGKPTFRKAYVYSVRVALACSLSTFAWYSAVFDNSFCVRRPHISQMYFSVYVALTYIPGGGLLNGVCDEKRSANVASGNYFQCM